jgi:hypothetical protein
MLWPCRQRRRRWLGDFLHPIGEASEVRLLREVAQLFGGNRGTDVEMLCDVLEQLEYRRHLALGEQIDLRESNDSRSHALIASTFSSSAAVGVPSDTATWSLSVCLPTLCFTVPTSARPARHSPVRHHA